MESISYPYQKNSLALIAGIVLLALILCPLSTLPIAFVLNPAGLVALVSDVGLLTLMGTCGLTLLVVLMGVWAIYASQIQMEAILTPETFSYGRRGRLTTTRLAEIVRITPKTLWWTEPPDWVITIESVGRQKISFVPARKLFGRRWVGFDYQAILAVNFVPGHIPSASTFSHRRMVVPVDDLKAIVHALVNVLIVAPNVPLRPEKLTPNSFNLSPCCSLSFGAGSPYTYLLRNPPVPAF